MAIKSSPGRTVRESVETAEKERAEPARIGAPRARVTSSRDNIKACLPHVGKESLSLSFYRQNQPFCPEKPGKFRALFQQSAPRPLRRRWLAPVRSPQRGPQPR